ncbi:hypothetical protein PL263_08865 [Methylomonas sp. EFPC3]|uniref:hypothetical protein n=1 Tax=Methylomonas sp. EFPC3 TaxID=3021710 RepID=UPI00241683F0|nr:hypothetical protein [Methylomonas sp. EFPC3]WFP52123.1 hypothetical protein PL263_08865 [Methylomonas sp. EFPC3]
MDKLVNRIFSIYLVFGAVTALAASPSLQSTLQLTATPSLARSSVDGKRVVIELQRTERSPAGLQIIDASDSRSPRLQGFLPLPQNGQLALSSDGDFAIVGIEIGKKNQYLEAEQLVIAIDLADPKHPKELWREKYLASKLVFAADAIHFAYASHSTRNILETDTTLISTEFRQAKFVIQDILPFYEMVFSPQAKYLVKLNSDELHVFDLQHSFPSQIKQSLALLPVDIRRFKLFDCLPTVLDSGYTIVEDLRVSRLGVYKHQENIPRISTMLHDQGVNFCKALNPNTADNNYLYADKEGHIRQLNVRIPNNPLLGKVWTLANDNIPLTAAQNLLVVGKKNSAILQFLRLDIDSQQAFDWQALERTHKSSISQYQNDLRSGKVAPALAAVLNLENAGIIQAIEVPLTDFPAKKAAEILNDYAFLVSKDRTKPAYLTETALKRALVLDPSRSVAHLNLADFLRENFASYAATHVNADVRHKEIEDHYRQYLNLGGKPNHIITSFFQTDPADICQLVSNYTNAGRLNELVSEAGTNIPFHNRMIDLLFTLRGTLGIPNMFVTDADNDFLVKQTEQPSLPTGVNDPVQGDNLGVLNYHDQYHILYYKDYQHPVSSVSLSDGKACKFN